MNTVRQEQTQPTTTSSVVPNVPVFPDVRDVHVKHVPLNTWRKARQQALAVNMSFREFVIRLLDQCDALVVTPTGSQEQKPNQEMR